MTSQAFTASWLVAAGLLSSWAVSAASDQPVTAPQAVSDARSYDLPPLSVEVDAEIARLAARTREVAPAAVPVRSLFEFAGRRRTLTPSDAEPPNAEFPNAEQPNHAIVDMPAPLPMVAPILSGVAETAGVLTAVVSFRDELHFVKPGDVIAARYRVDAVSVSGVDVFDLVAGTILRLALQA